MTDEREGEFARVRIVNATVAHADPPMAGSPNRTAVRITMETVGMKADDVERHVSVEIRTAAGSFEIEPNDLDLRKEEFSAISNATLRNGERQVAIATAALNSTIARNDWVRLTVRISHFGSGEVVVDESMVFDVSSSDFPKRETVRPTP